MVAESHATLVVAGLPLRVRRADGHPIAFRLLKGWQNGPATEPPVDVCYAVGDTSEHDLRLILDGGLDQGAYFTDSAGHLAVRGQFGSTTGPQLLRTVRDGYDYTLHFASAADLPEITVTWPRNIFMYALAARGLGLAAHACGIRTSDGAGVLCIGESGAGKSTLARLTLADRDLGAVVLSDDRVAVMRASADEPTRIGGTPWYSSAQAVSPATAPLAAVAILRHGGNPPRVRRIASGEIARVLVRTLALPLWNADQMDEALTFVNTLATDIPAYEFEYAPTADAPRALLSEISARQLS